NWSCLSVLLQVIICHRDVIPRPDDYCRPEESASVTPKSRFLARARNDDESVDVQRTKWDGRLGTPARAATVVRPLIPPCSSTLPLQIRGSCASSARPPRTVASKWNPFRACRASLRLSKTAGPSARTPRRKRCITAARLTGSSSPTTPGFPSRRSTAPRAFSPRALPEKELATRPITG